MRVAKLQLYLFLLVLPVQFCFTAAHPFYMSVCDLVYKSETQSLQIAVRIFTNDLETALKKAEGKAVDLYHPADSLSLEKQLNRYVQACLKIKINGQEQPMSYLGHEREAESCWLYFAIADCPKPLQLDLKNSLLYNSFRQQANIIQAEVDGIKKSLRLSFPEVNASFLF